MKRKQVLCCADELLAILACILIFAASAVAAGPSEKVLYHFQGGSDGAEPYARLVFDAAGNIYGTTQFGGAGCEYECGTVFQLTRDSGGGWKEAVLHRFTGPDGKYPHSALILDKLGNLYGTTSNGGGYGAGIVFKLTRRSNGTWKESILHHFGHGNDGANPFAGLIWDATGNLYGTAQGGGRNVCQNGCGTVFKLTPTAGGRWQESTLYAFKGGSDGSGLRGGLVFDKTGNLYGTTSNYPGTAFRLTPTSHGPWKKTLLHAFKPGADGNNPVGSLIIDGKGSLYGATVTGGACELCGIVFRLTPTSHGPWKKSTLHEFMSDQDGRQPYDSVAFDSEGNLYGATSRNGDPTCDCGTVFKLAPRLSGEWQETNLHIFKGSGDGAAPYGSVILDTEGNVYGTTTDDGWGLVYEIAP
jgi:uncharacterized repeat protein (TIGR03803 family)